MTKPKWIQDREDLKKLVEEPLIWIGERGAAGVINGLLPNGEPYTWYKRRDTKDTKYKGHKGR